jgi:hypothetical protein
MYCEVGWIENPNVSHAAVCGCTIFVKLGKNHSFDPVGCRIDLRQVLGWRLPYLVRGKVLMRDPRTLEQSQFLSGWKDIANYLGKGVRTVQRYERLMGLPVRRPAGRTAGSVVATRAELDAWVIASPVREVLQLTRRNSLPAVQTDAIKSNLEQMTKLREQMIALRGELMASVGVLRQTLYGLQSILQREASQRHRPMSLLDAGERRSHLSELLEMDPTRKAS